MLAFKVIEHSLVLSIEHVLLGKPVYIVVTYLNFPSSQVSYSLCFILFEKASMNIEKT